MIICHCRQVTERDVCEAMTRGARTRKQIVLACGAGGDCGGCVPAVDEILDGANSEPPACRSRSAA